MRMSRLGLIVLTVALTGSLALPPLFDGLSVRGQRALAVTLITVLLWTTRRLDAGVTSFLGIALLALSGAAGNVRQALAGFANPVPYFLVGVLAMGVAVAKSGLAERLARRVLDHARGSPARVYVQLVLAMPVLTFLLPSATTRSGILVHIYEEVFGLARVPAGAGIIKAVMLALSSINRLASTALLTGGITPVMSAALIGGMSWTGWFALMAVPYYALLVTGALLTWQLYRSGFAGRLSSVDLERRGRLTPREWRTLAVVLGASALWLTDALHHLDPALPALLAMVALLTPGLGPLVWSDLDRGVGWANFFVIGASISLALALADSGAAGWLAHGLVGGLPGLDWAPGPPGSSWPRVHGLASVTLLMLGATVLRAVVPNISGFLALAIPIAMSVAREVGLNPIVAALVVMMTGDAVLYYPAQSASALVIHERGHVSAGEILRFGLWMTALAYVVILVVALPYWGLVGQPLAQRPAAASAGHP
ncbi:MAG TPA: SLC13 family permease [Candidatus Methylomirabilis sp.]|nr:SLC13 family permease [Candidatus Methylomirabilis sp.]